MPFIARRTTFYDPENLEHTLTYVYACLLDARKAFDRVNHRILFAKLIDTQAHLLIVRVFCILVSMQNFCIRWGNSYSHYFTICNGVPRVVFYLRDCLLYM